jgi:hypothetical protein
MTSLSSGLTVTVYGSLSWICSSIPMQSTPDLCCALPHNVYTARFQCMKHNMLLQAGHSW